MSQQCPCGCCPSLYFPGPTISKRYTTLRDATPILTHNENQADHETGRPALYDNAIDTNYTHSIGIQKGHI